MNTELGFTQDGIALGEFRDFILSTMFENGLDRRHDFRLTPLSLELPGSCIETLNEIASVLPDYTDGLQRLVNISLINDKHRRTSRNFRQIRSIFGVNSLFNNILSNDFRREVEFDFEAEQVALSNTQRGIHPFVRMDLVIDPIEGGMKCVEIEVDKLHGLGYAALCRLMSSDPIGLGVVGSFAHMTTDERTLFLTSAFDKFYIPEARFFTQEVNRLGGNMIFMTQDDFCPGVEFGMMNHGIFDPGFGQLVQVPNLKGQSQAVNHTISELMRIIEGRNASILSDNNPALADKSLMAMITNPFCDEELEDILHRCFDPKTLCILRSVLPETMIPSSRNEKTIINSRINSGEDFFVKTTTGSGARGVFPPSDTDMQRRALKEGKNVIVQKAIPPFIANLPFVELQSGAEGFDEFSFRIGAFFVNGELSDVAVTASPGNVAHGGTTSIQMPARRGVS
jgi:hypothetical protein